MAHKFLFVSLVVIAALSKPAFLPKLSAITLRAHDAEINQAIRRQVLEATIRIRMIAPARATDSQFEENIADGPQDGNLFGYGLGTLAKIDSKTVIVTHDHWSLLSDPQTVILISSVVDGMNLVISRNEFVDLIRFRDSGTMILDAPAQLAARSSLIPELTTDSEQGVQPGDILYVVHRQIDVNDALSVEPMALKSIDKSDEPSSITLQSINGIAVSPGNSGGGVWHDGQLVANIWSAVLYQENGSMAGDYKPTNLSQAAQLPFLSSS
jgi:hypothetical protein